MFISIYIYLNLLYISIYQYIYTVYIYKYIFKKRTRVGHAFFSRERNILRSFAFFCLRTLRFLRSFTFFAFFFVLKKRMQRTHRSFGSHKSLKTRKRTEENVALFKGTQKNDALRTQKNTMPNPEQNPP